MKPELVTGSPGGFFASAALGVKIQPGLTQAESDYFLGGGLPIEVMFSMLHEGEPLTEAEVEYYLGEGVPLRLLLPLLFGDNSSGDTSSEAA